MRSNAKKGHSLIGFHSKAQCESPKFPPGFPGPHGLTVSPGGLRLAPDEQKCHFRLECDKIQPSHLIALSLESGIWSIGCVSMRRFSTEGLFKYIPASRGFTNRLGRMKPIFLKRTGDFLSENFNKKISSRIRGMLGIPVEYSRIRGIRGIPVEYEAIQCDKIPLANGISFKNPSTYEHST